MSKTIIPQPMFKPMSGRKAPPRPILKADIMGAVNPLRTPKQQVEGYLKRLRWTLPIPVDLMEVYLHCMPDSIRQLFNDGVFEASNAKKLSGKAINMVHSLSFHTDPNDGATHFSLDSMSDFMLGVGGKALEHKCVFWAKLPESVPRPMESKQVPLLVPVEHPHRKDLADWWKSANKMETEIQATLKVISSYSAVVDSVAAVQITWPDLLNFISLPTGVCRAITHDKREDLKTKVSKLVSPAMKIRIIQLLTTAAMIPETAQRPPEAWVGYFTLEFRDA